jgi:hypothetical protein
MPSLRLERGCVPQERAGVRAWTAREGTYDMVREEMRW